MQIGIWHCTTESVFKNLPFSFLRSNWTSLNIYVSLFRFFELTKSWAPHLLTIKSMLHNMNTISRVIYQALRQIYMAKFFFQVYRIFKFFVFSHFFHQYYATELSFRQIYLSRIEKESTFLWHNSHWGEKLSNFSYKLEKNATWYFPTLQTL